MTSEASMQRTSTINGRNSARISSAERRCNCLDAVVSPAILEVMSPKVSHSAGGVVRNGMVIACSRTMHPPPSASVNGKIRVSIVTATSTARTRIATTDAQSNCLKTGGRRKPSGGEPSKCGSRFHNARRCGAVRRWAICCRGRIRNVLSPIASRKAVRSLKNAGSDGQYAHWAAAMRVCTSATRSPTVRRVPLRRLGLRCRSGPPLPSRAQRHQVP